MSDSRRGALKLCLAICALPTLHGAALAEGTACKYVSQLPDDCAGAVLRKYDNLRNYRYEEIDLFARDVIKKVLYVSSYNTTGLNGGDESGDSAPQPLARSLDPKGIAKRYQALNVWVSPLGTGRLTGSSTDSEESGVLASSTPHGWATARRQRLQT